jgi:hypothetical protein
MPQLLRFSPILLLFAVACAPSLSEHEEAPLNQGLTKAVTSGGQKERFLALASPAVKTELQRLCSTPPIQPRPGLPHGGIPIEMLQARRHACEWPLTCKPTTREAKVSGFSTKRGTDGLATAQLTVEDSGALRSIQLDLSKDSNGEWRVATLPQCPDGLWTK